MKLSGILNTQIQYYPANTYETIPAGDTTVKEMLKQITAYSEYKQTFEAIRKAVDKGDEKTKDKLKSVLPSFTPAVTIKKQSHYRDAKTDKILFGKGRRQQMCINTFTGLMLLDFDKPKDQRGGDKKEVLKFKESLFKNKYVFASWVSSSGWGVRAIVLIPVISFDNYEQGVRV
jgi:hypothetical protein